MTHRFDIVIIGGGNAGFAVSKAAHAAGKTVAFIEERDFGGTCPNRGCTPKKVLVAAAQSLHDIALAEVHGITVGPATLDWPVQIGYRSCTDAVQIPYVRARARALVRLPIDDA